MCDLYKIQLTSFTELQKDEYLTILSWTRRENDRSWVGDIMQIVAVDLPFVYVKLRTSFYTNNGHLTLDMRECSIKKLSNEYAEAVLKTLKEN